jgi:FixJ family two-component response regulator
MHAKAIMVIDDDDKDIIRAVRLGLENTGFQVHDFTDPIPALQHVEQGCKQCEVLVSGVMNEKYTLPGRLHRW